MKKPTELKLLEQYIQFKSKGYLKLHVTVDHDMKHLLSKTMQHYFELPVSVQTIVRKSYSISGKLLLKTGKYRGFVFQMSHGGQQIKMYEPEKYKNERNTPLRIRSRNIFRLARKDPLPNIQTRIRELFRSYPYYLLKSEAVDIRLKNFYFTSEVLPGKLLKIYKALNPAELDPEIDELFSEGEYSPKKTIRFEYGGEDVQYFYAIERGNGRKSVPLKLIWGESIPGLE